MVSAGYNNITANPDNLNPNYISISSQSVYVGSGEIHSGVDFVLYQGAKIRGFITRDGINALPSVGVAVFNSNNVAVDQQVSGLDGKFVTNNISTGTYRVEPVVGSKEEVTPSTYSVTLAVPGSTVFSTTFTVKNALGYITGVVTYQGKPIKTGVLLVVTTTTLAGAPPVPPNLNNSTLTGASYFLTSSNEEGKYSLEVRQSTSPTYNVYGYYTLYPNFTILSSVKNSISVLSGQTTSGVNFSW